MRENLIAANDNRIRVLDLFSAAAGGWSLGMHRAGYTTFADGTSRSFETETRAQAENYAVGEKRKVGRDLLNRMTGATVRVTDVYVAAL